MKEYIVSEQVILVTGCSTGIGLASALMLQDKGYQVFTTARKPEDIQRLRSLGFPCHFMDYCLSQSITDTVQWVLREGSRIDALFNNGAYGQPGAVEDISRDVLHLQFEANFFGWHQLTNEVLREMRKQGRGRIIHNSSVLGFVALKFRGAYNASKFALEGLTDTLRLELKGTNIHVSLVEPGPIKSEFRRTAYRYFLEYIQIKASAHMQVYEQVQARLSSNELDAHGVFTLPPQAVGEQVIRALEASHPKARYPVTVLTSLLAVLKRILPTFLLDAILARGH